MPVPMPILRINRDGRAPMMLWLGRKRQQHGGGERVATAETKERVVRG